ncbi:V-type ATP synthase subunit I [Treponema sp.]|uniref:V-type ATP synthase subunit I n=1 Tax=Treponema sp. TaxID=166 RepID=UPI00298E3EB1|nr:V-type ATPase 116kDa subunit family protein [Treponema sp.]
MKKVSLVVLDREKKEALKTLRKIGVVHLENVEGKGEVLAKYKNISETLFNASMLLAEVKVNKKTFKYEAVSNDVAFEKAKRVLQIVDRKKELFDQITNLTTELDRFAAWGELDPKDFAYLSEKGIYISMYEIPSDKMALIPNEIKTILVNSSKSITRFLLLSDSPDAERPEGLPPEAFAVVLPETSTSQIMQTIKDAEAELSSIQNEFNSSVKYLNSIDSYYKLLQTDIEFENIYSGMETDGNCEECTNALAWITGYVPVDSFEKLASTAKENSWAMASSDPSEEDAVPTKLKNNKLVSLIYPLTDFLGTVPGYNEYDISGWFLLFFTIFFGMIFGDGGYGLLVTVVSLLLLIKNAFAKKSSPALALVFLVGLATVGWGLVTCTWFGLTPEQLPDWLTSLSVKYISNVTPSDYLFHVFWNNDPNVGLTTANNLQIFCFGLALLQLSVAHIKGIFRNLKRGSLKVLGELGSLAQLWGMFYIVLSMVVSSVVFPLDLVVNDIQVGKIALGLIGGGFALSFIFANYEDSIIKSILESVKNIISVLLGVVNVFSDIVSYIRLWAVGLAGAAISNTVNTMAGPLMGHAIMFAAAVLLLVFGHGLNMILNLLSVIVHGVRLNTLEFSTHLGMSWSGFKYKPFSETVNK